MRRMAVFQGVRMLRFRDVLGRCEVRDLSQLEAAEALVSTLRGRGGSGSGGAAAGQAVGEAGSAGRGAPGGRA